MKNCRKLIESLCNLQSLCVVSTCGGREPYANLVAFALAPDARCIFFATTRATHKYRNLSGNPRCALLIDNRGNRDSDFHQAVAVTAIGKGRELSGAAGDYGRRLLASRHPMIQAFFRTPTVACFEVAVERYILVERFQHVVEVDPGQWT